MCKKEVTIQLGHCGHEIRVACGKVADMKVLPHGCGLYLDFETVLPCGQVRPGTLCSLNIVKFQPDLSCSTHAGAHLGAQLMTHAGAQLMTHSGAQLMTHDSFWCSTHEPGAQLMTHVGARSGAQLMTHALLRLLCRQMLAPVLPHVAPTSAVVINVSISVGLAYTISQ